MLPDTFSPAVRLEILHWRGETAWTGKFQVVLI
jgi:hypothetical protein